MNEDLQGEVNEQVKAKRTHQISLGRLGIDNQHAYIYI